MTMIRITASAILFASLSMLAQASTQPPPTAIVAKCSSSRELSYAVQIYMGNDPSTSRTWGSTTMRVLPGKQAAYTNYEQSTQVAIRIDILAGAGSPDQFADQVDVGLSISQDGKDGKSHSSSTARASVILAEGQQRDIGLSPWTARISRLPAPPCGTPQ